jgi:hypothetical protein
MPYRLFTWVLFIGTSCISCSKTRDNDHITTEKIKVVKEQPKPEKPNEGEQINPEAHPSDTVIWENGINTVIGLTISPKEYDSLSPEKKEGIDELLSDFEYYLGETAKELKGNGIKFQETASRFVKANAEIIDKRQLKQTVGYLIIDKSGKTLLLDGLSTQEELVPQIKAHLHL